MVMRSNGRHVDRMKVAVNLAVAIAQVVCSGSECSRSKGATTNEWSGVVGRSKGNVEKEAEAPILAPTVILSSIEYI